MKGAGGAQGMFVEGYGEPQPQTSNQVKKMPPNLSAGGKKVLHFLQNTPQNNEGLHVSMIAAQLGMQASDVFKAGDELLGNGAIYTTVDDETWAILEY